jgi:hypothetical protein
MQPGILSQQVASMKRSGIEDTNASNLDYASLHRGYLTLGSTIVRLHADLPRIWSSNLGLAPGGVLAFCIGVCFSATSVDKQDVGSVEF